MQQIMLKVVTLGLVLVCCGALSKLNRLNVIPVNISNVFYKRLMITRESVLVASPLAILDVGFLKKHKCYRNIRTNCWSFMIPIKFWDDSYMAQINSGIQKINKLKNFTDEKSFVLPPSGFLVYRLNWRRGLGENLDTDIRIDSSWYPANIDYVLPKWQTFLIEFPGKNDSNLCTETKTRLLNETFQSFELAIDFKRNIKNMNDNQEVVISIRDIKSVKLFNESGCDLNSGNRCTVSRDYAEKWAYDVSVEIMKNISSNSLSLQGDIYEKVIQYLCKDMVPVRQVGVKRLKNVDNNELVCQIPRNVTRTYRCDNMYGYRYECLDYDKTVVSKLSLNDVFSKVSQFSIPITKL